MGWKNLTALLMVSALFFIIASCRSAPTTTPPNYSQYELEYRLLTTYPDFFYCDPDYYPVAREGQEQQNANDQFATIKANTAEFSAILNHLDQQDKADYSDAAKLAIYREHKLLTRAIQMTATTTGYQFTLRTGEGQGKRIDGTISTSGVAKVTKQETSFNTCPICLTKGTLIATPSGNIPIEELREGMPVWTVDESGDVATATILQTSVTPVPQPFSVVKITLNDGRTVTASPGHPTAEGKELGNYRAGDTLDGALVESVDILPYNAGVTYDILPSGGTGLYWANGVLLKSTLAVK